MTFADRRTQRFDYEGEAAVILGKGGKDFSQASAREALMSLEKPGSFTRSASGVAIGEPGRITPPTERRVEMRDVGHGEQSGYARLPELIHRLNQLSPHLGFYMDCRLV